MLYIFVQKTIIIIIIITIIIIIIIIVISFIDCPLLYTGFINDNSIWSSSFNLDITLDFKFLQNLPEYTSIHCHASLYSFWANILNSPTICDTTSFSTLHIIQSVDPTVLSI